MSEVGDWTTRFVMGDLAWARSCGTTFFRLTQNILSSAHAVVRPPWLSSPRGAAASWREGGVFTANKCGLNCSAVDSFQVTVSNQ